MSGYYEVTFNVKKKGAIGNPWPKTLTIQAATPTYAASEVKALLLAEGYEVDHLSRVLACAPPVQHGPILVSTVPPVILPRK